LVALGDDGAGSVEGFPSDAAFRGKVEGGSETLGGFVDIGGNAAAAVGDSEVRLGRGARACRDANGEEVVRPARAASNSLATTTRQANGPATSSASGRACAPMANS
jgi:hypothetical protein